MNKCIFSSVLFILSSHFFSVNYWVLHIIRFVPFSYFCKTFHGRAVYIWPGYEITALLDSCVFCIIHIFIPSFIHYFIHLYIHSINQSVRYLYHYPPPLPPLPLWTSGSKKKEEPANEVVIHLYYFCTSFTRFFIFF